MQGLLFLSYVKEYLLFTPSSINPSFLKKCNVNKMLLLECERPTLLTGGYFNCVTFMLHNEGHQLSKRLGKYSAAGELGNFLCGQVTKKLKGKKLPALN